MNDRPWLCPRDETCPATKGHDTFSAYHYGCPSGKARDEHRLYNKRRREGRHVGRRHDPTGLRRRIEACQLMGWRTRDLAAHADTAQDYLVRLRKGRFQFVTTQLRDKLIPVLDKLAHEPGPSQRTRTWAANSGFLSVMVWDDIDDPDEQPDLGGVDQHADHNIVEAVENERVTWADLTDADREHLVGTLFRRGWATADIAERASADVEDVRRAHARVHMRKKREAAA